MNAPTLLLLRLAVTSAAMTPLLTLAPGCSRDASAKPPVTAPAPQAAAAALERRFGATKGCFTLQDLDSAEIFEYGGDECGVRTSPASTFKIPNAIIGLDLGVLEDETTTYRWDGTPTWNSTWNRDHDLASAIRNSVVWYFQKEAEAVGTERYRSYLSAFHYGNEDPSGPVRMFWLNDTLKIAPREELRFMRDLYTDNLPAKPRSRALVRHMLEFRGKAVPDLRERFPFVDAIPADVVFSGKTGTAIRDEEAVNPDVVAWFVGALEGRGHRYVFACRMRSHDKEKMGPAAARVAYDYLHEDRHLL